MIIDFVGASYWENHTRCVAVDGRIVLLGLVKTFSIPSLWRDKLCNLGIYQLGGGVTENPLDMGVLLRKRVSLVCSTLRSRSLHYKHRLVQEVNFSYTTVFPPSVAAGTICFSATNLRCLFKGGYYI